MQKSGREKIGMEFFYYDKCKNVNQCEDLHSVEYNIKQGDMVDSKGL
jgi:hypothetical protein